jgi:hypothetical protein
MLVSHKGHELNSVIKDTVKFFKANFIDISLLTLKVELPFILIKNLNLIGQIPEILDLWASFVALAYFLVVIPFSFGAQAILYSQIIHGSELNYKECLAASRKQIYHMVIASFLFLLMLLSGLVLFIVPGIIIGARLSYFPFFIVFEELRPIVALEKSFNATKGYGWKIASPILFFYLISNSLLFFSHIISDKGFLSFLSWVVLEFALSVFVWLILIVAFRFYCHYKNEESLN